MAVGLAVRMARYVAEESTDQGFVAWVQHPLHTLGAGVPFSNGSSAEQTPPRFRAWAEEVVACLRQSYARDAERGTLHSMASERGEDTVCLMERWHRSGNSRRRARDSRSPRRGSRPTCMTSSHSTGHSGRAQRLAEREARLAGRDAPVRRSEEEYVLVRVDDSGPVEGATPSGSGTNPRATNGGEASRGPAGRSSGPELPRPLTLQGGIDLWRYMLFSRTALGPELEGGARVPESFLPRRLLVEISDRHQTMTLEDRAVSTLALMTVIRFLAAELSHTVQEADSFARARENRRRLEGEPDTDDDLLLQLSMLQHGGQGQGMHPEVCEEAGLMQLFFANDGKDSLQQRWSRNMLRLQKELMQQEDATRRGCISTLLLALGAVMSEGVRDSWQGQLHALLVAVMADTTPGMNGSPDEAWLKLWMEELSTFVPGLQLAGPHPIQVESQSQPMDATEGITADSTLMTAVEIDKLLEDEQEEEARREEERRLEAKRQAHRERLCAEERAHLVEEAAAYQAWEDSQIRQFLDSRVEQPGSGKRRCILHVEASSGSMDRPRVQQVFSLEVPSDGQATLTIKAQMEDDPDEVSTQMVPSPTRRAVLEGDAVEGQSPKRDTGSSLEVERHTIPRV